MGLKQLELIKALINMIRFQSKNTLPQTRATFRAFVAAIVPDNQEPGDKNYSVQSEGALSSHIDQYLIWSLDNYLSIYIFIKDYHIHLANVTAEVLNIAAKQLIYLGENKHPVNPNISPEDGTFAALAPSDRFRAITLLEQLKINAASLPVPFSIKPELLLSTVVSLVLLPVIGYYTEWSGYDSTGTEKPEKRRIEHFPTPWKQVGYPGPVKGYHAFRGYLVKKFKE